MDTVKGLILRAGKGKVPPQLFHLSPKAKGGAQKENILHIGLVEKGDDAFPAVVKGGESGHHSVSLQPYRGGLGAHGQNGGGGAGGHGGFPQKADGASVLVASRKMIEQIGDGLNPQFSQMPGLHSSHSRQSGHRAVAPIEFFHNSPSPLPKE